MVDLEPEFWKQMNGPKRYEALMGAVGGLGLNLDAAEELVAKYDPPAVHSWQVPSAEELAKQLKATKDAFNAFHRNVAQYQGDLMAKDWSV